MRCDGRNNIEKLSGFISIVVPQKKILFLFFGGEVEQMIINRKTRKNSKFKFDKKSY